MNRKINLTHLPFLTFMFAYFLICGLTYKDFGITDDERVERKATKDLSKYLSEPTNAITILGIGYNYTPLSRNSHHPLMSKYQRSYQFFQSVVNPKEFYEWDHLINMAFASLLFIIAYVISYIHYRSVFKSMIILGFLFFTPRLIGDIPANNKDTPFAIMYLASIATIYLTSKFKINNYLEILALGIIFGFTQTFRAVGFSIYIVYILYFLINSLESKSLRRETLLDFFYKLVSIGLISLPISILFFPWLGSNLIANLPAYLFNSSKFQEWNNTILFNGQFLTKDQRPWYYLFTWLFITTPVAMLALVPAGLARMKILSKNPLFLLSALSLIVNLFLYLVLQPVIYNALRHFIFILPSIAIMSAITFIHLYEHLKKNYKYALVFLVILNAATVLNSYVMLHPYQYIYFNELIGGLKGAVGRYETDYWGTTYKETSEWLGQQDNIDLDIYVFTCQQVASVDYFRRGQFSLSSEKHPATYSFCDVDDELKKGGIPGTQVYHEIKRMGVTLNTIRKYDFPGAPLIPVSPVTTN